MQSSSSSDPTTSIPTATSHIHSYRSTQLQQPATGSVDQDALFAEIALMATPDFNIRSIKGRQGV